MMGMGGSGKCISSLCLELGGQKLGLCDEHDNSVLASIHEAMTAASISFSTLEEFNIQELTDSKTK